MTIYCSFCGKSQHDVIKLVAGPSVYICNECIVLAVDCMLIPPRDLMIRKLDEWIEEQNE